MRYEYRLPWPPSVNAYWRHNRGKTHIGEHGKRYRQDVLAAVLCKGPCPRLASKLRVVIAATPPDMRRRDLDNVLKAPLDALAFAGVYLDDSQIDEVRIFRNNPAKPGALVVVIEEL